MNSSPSTPSSSSGSQPRDDFTHIEALEQELLNHIRTSGLRKPRETSLIDEVMVIRRERRRLFAALSTKTTDLERRKGELSEELNRVLSDSDSRCKKLSEELQQLKISSRQQQRRVEEKLDFKHKLAADDLRSRFEAKTRLIESKLQEIMLEKERKDNKVHTIHCKHYTHCTHYTHYTHSPSYTHYTHWKVEVEDTYGASNSSYNSTTDPRCLASNSFNEQVSEYSIWVFLGCWLIQAVISFYSIVEERTKRLFGSLRRIGLMDSAYWMSWFVTYQVLTIIASLLALAVKALCEGGSSMLKNIDYDVMFVLLYMAGSAFMANSFFLASFVSSSSMATNTYFLQVLMAMITNACCGTYLLNTYRFNPQLECVFTSSDYNNVYSPLLPGKEFVQFLVGDFYIPLYPPHIPLYPPIPPYIPLYPPISPYIPLYPPISPYIYQTR